MSTEAFGGTSLPELTRRKFIALGATAFTAGVFGGEVQAIHEHAFDRTLYRELMEAKMETRYLFTEVGVPGLPRSADGLCVVFLTDIHADSVGRTRNDPETLLYTGDCVNDCTQQLGLADEDILLAVGGDLVNEDFKWRNRLIFNGTDLKTFNDSLVALHRIRAGKRIAQSGNHEAANRFGPYFRDRLLQEGYSHLGDDVLTDSYRGVRLVGLKDYTTDAAYNERKFYRDRATMEAVSALLSGEDPKIVFSHSPAAFDIACVSYLFQNIHAFSGHLHGFNAPPVGIAQQTMRWGSVTYMRKHFLEGNLFESQRKLPGSFGLPSTLEIANGFGNHFIHSRTPRTSAYTIVIKQFRCADQLWTPQYS